MVLGFLIREAKDHILPVGASINVLERSDGHNGSLFVG